MMKSTNGVLEPLELQPASSQQHISMISHHAQCGSDLHLPMLPASNSSSSSNGFLSSTLPRQQRHFTVANGYTATLPKPPLKGILKNSSGGPSVFSMLSAPIEVDVLPFDSVPPCDDCLKRARVEGSYGDVVCHRAECALGVGGSLKSRERERTRPGSRQQQQGQEAVTAFRGSQESVYNCEGEGGQEVIENVESSV